MQKLHKDQQGSHLLVGILAVIAMAIIVFAGYRVVITKEDSSNKTTGYTNPEKKSDEPSQDVVWGYNGQEWMATGTPPECADPFPMELPVDISQVESVLYPGQQRSTGYKPHGGLKLKSNDNEVRAPFDSKLISGSRYLESGEVQYLFFFVNPCGMAYRFDHLLTLSPEFQNIADTLPQPQVDDSKTTNFTEQKEVKKGTVIATAAGHTGNPAFDLGVYDLRQPNEASQDPAYKSAHQSESSQAFYGVCWLDMMPEKDQLYALPATDMASGKTSDYCK